MGFDENTLKRKILRDEYNTLIFSKRKGTVYLVGGYIRDLLRGITSRDRDYIISMNRASLVREIRERAGGKAIQFRKGDMVRIALKKEITLDFSGMAGTLYEDLSQRDFTINALAWSPDEGLIDIFHGLEDLKNKTIRSIAKENIIADPLRMLRAYRFAAEIDGRVEAKTRNIIKILNHLIKDVSTERITLEMFHLLNSEQAAKHLNSALIDGLLCNIIILNYNELNNNIKSIARAEKGILKVLPDKFKVRLKKLFSQNLTWKGLICLEMLIKSSGKSNGLNLFMKISNRIGKRIQSVHRALEKLSEKKPDLFSIFMGAGEAAVDALIISRRIDLLLDYDRFCKIWRGGFLSSEEISRISGIDEGTDLGKIILEVKREQFEGRIRTRAQAVKYLKGPASIKPALR